jgi:adenylosuccinate synthase
LLTNNVAQNQAQETNKKILVEGSQALLLDLDWGTYPYVTSSNTCLGGIVSGLALKRRNIKEVIGVVKAYTTRVGSGPFPTEDLGEVGKSLQKLGGEVGVSTGRTRRCGWLDLVVLKYSCAINDYDSLNLDRVEVMYDEVPGWKTSTSKTRQWSELPKEARDYVEHIEKFVKFVSCKVKWIGTGPDRDDMIVR